MDIEELRIDQHGNATIRFGDRAGVLVVARSIGEPVIVPDYDAAGSVRTPPNLADYLPERSNAFVLGQNSRTSLFIGGKELAIYAVQFYRIQ